jgi:protocatechuate 3,4-dioxygenase alpha subunit
MPGQTPSQTVGPYFAYGLTPLRYGHSAIAGTDLFPGAAGQSRITLRGRVLDGEGANVPDAMIEIWQAAPDGRAAPAMEGFGRIEARAEGYAFTTLRPGSIGAPHAPHLGVILFMRGLLTHLFTRIYFPEDSALHASDPVLSRVPAERRPTLLALREGEGYRFDFVMQGPRETVFLEF